MSSSGGNRSETADLVAFLNALGANPLDADPSRIRIAPDRIDWIYDALRGLNLPVQRSHPNDAGAILDLPAPNENLSEERLRHAIQTVFDPDALLFDLDGVLADVSDSYRKAIRETAASFGVDVDTDDIADAKMEGDANNDWVLTRRLIEERGTSVELDEVVEVFERFYHGTEETAGFHEEEDLLVDPEWIAALADTRSLGIVTGRPSRDAHRFLNHQEIEHCFDAVVCMDDVENVKPDPEPVLTGLDELGTGHAWFLGDTPDDMEAATAAGLPAIGVVPPGDTPERVRPHLNASGACRILASVRELTELLPL